ncbi:MAG TPA: hypothetical protein VGL56_13300 [Fimbriimonadaceae bacterium]|jgi:hypothetical protein
MRKSWLWPTLCLAIAGCKGTTTPSADASTKLAVQKDQSSTSYTDAAATTSSGHVEATLGSIPDNLKTEGFSYFGLDNLKPQTMKVVTEGQQVQEGGIERKLLKVTPQTALYQQDYIGNLANYGSVQVEARPDGVYTVAQDGNTLPKPELELPAIPTKGKQWQIDGSTTVGGKAYHEMGTATIIGPQKLKIGDKVYDALLVDETKTINFDKTTWADTDHTWYVKGLGQVKTDSTLKGDKGSRNIVLLVTG